MKIGLYFGSFNPVHVGHLIIANHIVNETDCDQVWLVVSPRNPLKNPGSLLNEYDRLHLVNLAIGEFSALRSSNIEFSLPRPSYTIDTLTYLEEQHPHDTFAVIMGSDSLCNLPRWKNHDLLLEKYPLYVYLRPGFTPPELLLGKGRITICSAPLLDISSTIIRKLIQSGKSARYLVPEKAFTYMMENNYYRS